MEIKQCPNCNNNIRLHPIKFPAINDFGGVVVKCKQCSEFSYFNTINPDELSISLGAYKIDTWDKETISEQDFIKKYPNIKELKVGLIVVGDFEKREYSFNFKSDYIYFCKSCGKEVETISNIQLLSKRNEITSTYSNLINYILANSSLERENLIIEIKCECNCKQSFTSFWSMKYELNNKQPLNFNKLMLIGTDMPLKSDYINGIKSKSSCINILEKFIIRWNTVFSKLLIVTPFVGHQWMSKEQLIELWDWMKNYVNPEKTTLVTRTATFNKYKKACADYGISLDLLNTFGINNPVITDFTRKTDFHAKVYVGYSTDKSEIIMGSFNLLNGPSMENISFNQIEYSKFIEKFISPMKIKIDKPKRHEKYWSHIYQDNKNKWISYEIESNKILEKIMKYE